MERIVRRPIEKLPEGVDLGTSEDVPGLVAQGRTMPLDYPLVVAAE